MFELFPDQIDVVNDLRNAMRSYKNILIQCETGFGKTVVATDITSAAVNKGNLVFFICHRQSLIDQTYRTFGRGGIKQISFIAAQYPAYSEKSLVQICSIGTLVNRINSVNLPVICIWDEAHHLGAKTWSKVKDAMPNAYHIGLSATPERLDGTGLGNYFDVMIQGPPTNWLIENGRLSDYDIYSAASTPDTTELHCRAGDYKRDELVVAMDKSQITGDIIDHWRKHAAGKRTVGFAVSIEHSMHIVEQFNKANIRALHLDSKMKKEARIAAAKALVAGDLDIIFNVDLFGEGYDLAAQAGSNKTIDAVICARPTQSRALSRQQTGRALRVKEDGSNAIILDHANNWMRHGLPDDHIEWTLDSKKRDSRKKNDDETDVMAKQCNKCFAVHRPAPRCPYCGYEYPIKSREIEHAEGELKKVDKEKARRKFDAEMYQAKTARELTDLFIKRGSDPIKAGKRAAHVLRSRREKQEKRAQSVLHEYHA